MPEWLAILVKKYVDEYSKGKYGVDSIGRFACFLSVCVSGDIQITAAEGRALQTLIHARLVTLSSEVHSLPVHILTNCLQ